MKPSVSSSCVLTLTLCVACSAGGDGAGSGNSAGASSSAGGSHAGAGTGGAPAGGAGTAAGAGGAATGGASNGGSAGASAAGASGAGGAGAGGSGGGVATGFKCPASPGTFALPTGKAEHIPGTTPIDSFNMNAGFTNVEGPVWIGDSLYFSEMTSATPIPPARILKIGPGNVVSIAVANSGSNGMAVDGSGNLFAAISTPTDAVAPEPINSGAIAQVTLPGGPVMPVVSTYMSNRFISPNDLAIRSDGTIYFSDPNYQNSTMPPPQSATRLYRVSPPPARTVTPVTDAPMMPNGVTLSPDEMTLYVDGSGGFKKFAVMADGSLGPASDFASDFNGDGMAADCAGNLYVAGGSPSITVYSPAGTSLGTIQLDNGGTTTNVAFGGMDHKTIYITAQGNDGQRGVFSIASSIAGLPY
jgi:gluconolactonase